MDLMLQYKPVKHWHVDVPQQRPEIICISRPYIDQLLLRAGWADANEIFKKSCSWGDHHHSHFGPWWSKMDVENIKSLEELLKTESLFTFRDDLRYREEEEGVIVAHIHSVYFVNNLAAQLLSNLGHQTTLTQVSQVCQQLGIPQEAGEQFFKKLMIFGLVRLDGSSN